MTENGQDKDVIWHDRPSITKYHERVNSRQELAVLAKEEPWKEMGLLSLRGSYQTIKDNLIFFLEKSVAEKHIKSISITLQESDSGDEVDDHDDDDEDEDDEDEDDEDDEDEDDEGEDDEGEDAVDVNLPAPQPKKFTLESGQAVESVAEPLEPDDAASSLDQVVLEGLTFEKALTIATKHKGLRILKADDDVAKVKAQSKMWLPIIMKILDKHYCTKPTFVDLQEVLPTFEPWQKTHLEMIRTHLDSDPQLREAHAIVLFSTVIHRHEARLLKVCSSRDQRGMDKSLKCSERLKLVIAAIEKSAIVGKDVISGDRIDELINSPTAAVKSKENNKRTNERKKTTEPNKGQDDDKDGGSGAGTHVKRGSASDVAKTDGEKLLAGCTFLADIEGDTDEEDGTRLQTDEVKFDGAR
jgi:hypothetical protein